MKTSILKHARTASTVIIILLFSISLWQLAAAGWIQGKAIIAQQLLNHAWNRTLISPENSASSNFKTSTHRASVHRPWPWADTWPVAKLIVPQLGIEQIILAGDSGSSLAFGPGHSMASAEPNTPGTTLISGHRDTHFRFLNELKINDVIYMQTTEKKTRYRVYDLQIVNSEPYILKPEPDGRTLVLATCYPFNDITSGNSSRYLVFAGADDI